jgi:hypothetical protein
VWLRVAAQLDETSSTQLTYGDIDLGALARPPQCSTTPSWRG